MGELEDAVDECQADGAQRKNASLDYSDDDRVSPVDHCPYEEKEDQEKQSSAAQEIIGGAPRVNEAVSPGPRPRFYYRQCSGAQVQSANFFVIQQGRGFILHAVSAHVDYVATSARADGIAGALVDEQPGHS